MTSPCRRHFEKVRAAQAAAAAAPTQSMAGATTYELQLSQLAQDRARLKNIQSEQGKAELKRELLPAYAPYVEGVLSAGQGAQDEVLTTLMVWCMDAGDYRSALDIADYVLRHGLLMPDRFARTTGCLVAEEVANAALKAQKAGGTFDLAVLERTQELTAEQDMPDEARAKLLLATGRATLDGEAPELPRLLIGIDLLKRAIDLHSSCGGKKDLERAERLLKNIAAQEAPEASAAAD